MADNLLPLPLREMVGVTGMNQPIERAKELRIAQTPAESKLWSNIRDRQLNGRKWRGQQVIDYYIVDFYCSELRLVVEIDGDVHVFQEEKDKIRQAYLENLGLRVIRFTNNDVMDNLEGVLTVLWDMCR